MNTTKKTSDLPVDIDAERIVLGTIINDRSVLDEVREILFPECFYSDFHRSVYGAIIEISNRGDRPDMITVSAELKRTQPDFNVIDLMQITDVTSFDIYQHAARINELATRRKVWQISQQLMSDSLNETTDIGDAVEIANTGLSSVFTNSTTNISTIKDAFRELYENHIQKNIAGGNELTGSPTGFKQLDLKSGGLQSGNLYIIAAETSMGKTSLAINILTSAALCNHSSAFYSLEMGKAEICARMASAETGIKSSDILYNPLNSYQLEEIDGGISRLANIPVYFDDRSGSDINTILSSIRTMKLKYGISGAVVDYLQILNVNTKTLNKEQAMADVARRLKNLAKDLGIWIIALSQLNRDTQNPVPSLGRLRDSGQIAEAADVVILIYRPEVYGKSYADPFQSVNTSGTALIDVAKGRNIGLTKFVVGFDAEKTKFYDLDTLPPVPAEKEPF